MPEEPNPQPTENRASINVGNVGGDFTGNIAGRDISIGQQILNFFTGTSDQQRDLRNRQVMLTAVRKFWVEGVLEQSLHGVALIELGMAEKKEAVNYPWDMVLQRPDQPNRQLPPNTKMIDVFDQAGRSLLILGGPGSGKTTMLLELARQTIDRAEADPAQPIPVVFNLSSWAEKRLKLAEWLVEELNTKYQIPTRVAQKWVEEDALLLLLDGLDEVAQPHRVACVEAINRRQSLMPLVVCSRQEDYEVLSVKLHLSQAILLQPLSEKQVETYLAQFGADLSGLESALQQDANFQELARSPLILSIMVLAYQKMRPETLPQFDSIEAQYRHLFEVYVWQMLARRGGNQPYPANKTQRWLSWLAAGMASHSQTEFLLERLQPSWLQPRQKRIYLASKVLVFGLNGGLIGWLSGGLSIGLISGLFFGLMSWSDNIKPTGTLTLSWSKFKNGLIFALIFGLIGGLISRLFFGLFSGALFGLIAALIFWLPGELRDEVAKMNLRPNQSIWYSLRNGLIFGLIGGLISVLFFRLTDDLVFGLTSGLVFGLSVGLIIGLILGLSYGVLGGLFSGLTDRLIAGLFFGLKLGLLAGLIFGLLFGLTFGLLFGLIGGLIGGLGGELSGGLLFGLIFGVFSGLSAFTHHFILRFICYRQGYMPWNYVRFLDYAAERILLRKVGGGYIFVHRYLMEYFASLEENDNELRK